MSHQLKRKWFKKWHKWPSIVLSLFILLFSISGIVLNHRHWFSNCDISRRFIPSEYRYKNWNLAAIKGSLSLNTDSILIYGNIGVWLTDKNFSHFNDYNQGFPKGIDNRKINSLVKSKDGSLFAGTLFGLYRFSTTSKGWEKLLLPVSEERVVKILVNKDSLWVLTRSNLLLANLSQSQLSFSVVKITASSDDDNKTGLFRTLWVIHSGEIYGITGRLLIDFTGLVFIFLTLTGLVYFITPYVLKRMKDGIKSSWKKFNRVSLKWHNLTGSWLIILLILTTVTGMFLRPPLLIPISAARVGKLPFTLLDDPNPWNDKFRDMIIDEENKRFLLATSEGIYFSHDNFKSSPEPFPVQPPVSVMGINVLEKKDSISYLIGSFSGLYLWQPDNSLIRDYINGEIVNTTAVKGIPFGSFTLAGYLKKENGQEVVFDYANGAMFSQSNRQADTQGFPSMPQAIADKSPMSLWNLALEFHTCRIYGAIIGNLYILLIPLFGLGILFVLVTGFFSWYYKPKKAD